MTINNKPIYKTKNDLSVIGSELTSGTNIVTVIGDAYFFILTIYNRVVDPYL